MCVCVCDSLMCRDACSISAILRAAGLSADAASSVERKENGEAGPRQDGSGGV